MMAKAEVHPTYIGYVNSTEDADLLLDACLQGSLPKVSRRLRADEQEALIKSGSVFIYDESATNIKRWTDGRSWTSRRSSGEFYIYHELEDKKGSMPKDDGLVRKTAMLNREGVSYRLVSYFTEDDVQAGILTTPSSCIQSESLGIYQEICFDSQDLGGDWEQLFNQLAMLSPAGITGWETFQSWPEHDTNLQFDQEIWLDPKDEINTDFNFFEPFSFGQEI